MAAKDPARRAQHKQAIDVIIDDKPSARRITIDDELFVYYTQGDIVVTPARLSSGEDDPTAVVVHIPVLAQSVRWVGQEDET